MSFISDYLEYAANNEAPRMFHVWAGYAALGAAIGRRAWLPFGVSALYCNPYVMLVGDAGNGKSRAMYNCMQVLKRVKPPIAFTGSKETPAGLWRFMTGDPDAKPVRKSPVMELVKDARCPDGVKMETHPMFIRANEFIDFIGLDPQGWVSALNNISDEDMYHYRTKNGGEDKIAGPYICMLAGLTTEISHSLQKQNIIATGLARRTWFQFGQRRFHDPHAILTQTEAEILARDRCVEHLDKIRHIGGPFTWSEETQKWWTNWYNEHTVTVPKKAPQVRSWFASKPDQMLRLAMLDSLSEGFNLQITIENLKTANHYFSNLERELHRIFGGVGRNELATVAGQFYDFISLLTEPISKRQLKAKMMNVLDAKRIHAEFEDAINLLLEDGRIAIHSLTVGNFIDSIIATPEVMKAWAERAGHVVKSWHADVVQIESDRLATNPSPAPTEPPPNGPKEEPPNAVPFPTETSTDPSQTEPKLKPQTNGE